MNMFESKKPLAISSFTEKQLISHIVSMLGETMPKAPFGAGDDCAVLDPKNFPNKFLCTNDAVIFGRHFDEKSEPFKVGRKLLNRNISDIAAMGGVPKFALISAIIAPNLSIEWLDEFCKGLKSAAQEWGVLFIGGDTASAGDNFFSMHLTLLGDVKNPLLRVGAKIGDTIFTTGTLGASFESGRHLDFTPRVKEGQFLTEFPVSSCTDISDGLASDIFDILPKNACAVLDAEKIPIFDFPNNSLNKALCDGEDYELLFTLSKDADSEKFLSAYKNKFGKIPFEIGKICAPDLVKSSSKAYLKFGDNFDKIFDENLSSFCKKIDENLCEFSENGFSHFT